MNAERDALLKAFDAFREAENREHAARLKAVYELLLERVLERNPYLKKATLHSAVMKRYPMWLRAGTKPSALPPKA